MRILGQDSDKGVDQVTLYLTEAEARILQGYLEQLLATAESAHCHASSDDYQQEITVTIVREHQLGLFDQRSQDLWRTGK